MQITLPLLPHLPFFEALSVLDESNPAWAATVAGLLTVRLVDTWSVMARRGERVQAWEVAGVAEAVDALPESHPARAPLRAVVDAVLTRDVTPAAALTHLSDYARALRLEAQWLLAADVFSTILSNAYGAPDDLVISAAYHRGYCFRMAGQLDAAAASYDEGRALAASCGNEDGLLEADVSHAALAMHRGNLPAAQMLLDGVIERANQIVCRHVLGRALHDRATVAARRGQPEEAVVYGYRALPLFGPGTDQDRVLGDIAAALGDAGHLDAAWDAHLLLSGIAQAQETRWVAKVNLIEIASWRGDEPLFERFRAELEPVALPTWLLAHYHLLVGSGYQRFGKPELGARALRGAIALATAHQLNEVRMRAEKLLDQTDLTAAVPHRRAAPPTGEVREVIDAIRTLRELAGVDAD